MKYFDKYRVTGREKYTYSLKGQLVKFIIIFVLILFVLIKYLK